MDSLIDQMNKLTLESKPIKWKKEFCIINQNGIFHDQSQCSVECYPATFNLPVEGRKRPSTTGHENPNSFRNAKLLNLINQVESYNDIVHLEPYLTQDELGYALNYLSDSDYLRYIERRRQQNYEK